MILNKLTGSWKFFLAVLGVYLLLYLIGFKYLIIGAGLETISVIIKILPILLVVFIITLMVNLYTKDNRLAKYMGPEAGKKGWFYSVILGILVSGPPYLLFPLLGEVKKGGASHPLLAVFLYNRNVKIPFVPVMVYYFGLAFTIIISFYIILFSILNGLTVGYLMKNEN